MVGLLAVLAVLAADEPPRCEVEPLPHDQVSLRIGGREVSRWHFGDDAPRPFLYPFNGPSGVSLVRMGHPGAPNHDHHRGVWFAHHDVEGQDFWSENGGTQIRQREWLAYEDGPAARAAFVLDWIGQGGERLIEQTVVFEIRPDDEGQLLEVQTTLRPASGRDATTLRKTNFGLLAVRVAKSISAVFGDGELSDSDGRVGEKAIFGRAAKWMDYSGPIAVGVGEDRRWVREGITFFDHPTNPDHPTKWHVRDDGWMGASLCMDTARVVTAEKPLTLRYLLFAHGDAYDADSAKRLFRMFADSKRFEVIKKPRTHTAYGVRRVDQ